MRIADIIALIALVVCVLIGLIIAGNLQNVNDNIAGTLNSSDYNTTSTTLFQNTWSALTLASVGIIIAAAVGILSLVMSALGRAGGPGI